MCEAHPLQLQQNLPVHSVHRAQHAARRIKVSLEQFGGFFTVGFADFLNKEILYSTLFGPFFHVNVDGDYFC